MRAAGASAIDGADAHRRFHSTPFPVVSAQNVRFRLLRFALLAIACTVPLRAAPPLPPVLTKAAQIRSLTREQASQGLPVQLRGVVTFAERVGGTTYVQDETGGVYVRRVHLGTSRPPPSVAPVESGTLVEVEGVTMAGELVAFVGPRLQESVTMRELGSAPLPEPLRPARSQLLDPRLHNQWVELDALVSEARGNALRMSLELVTAGRRFRAAVNGQQGAGITPATLAGSDIRIRGVFRALIDESRQMVGFRLSVPSPACITVYDERLEAAFARPALGVEDLAKFDSNFADRARVTGTVLAATTHEFVLRTTGGALWVRTAQSDNLQPGQVVDVVGFPETIRDRTTLTDAVVRATAQIQAPTPRRVRDRELENPALDGELVQIEARLIAQLERTDGGLFLLRSDRLSFYARSMPNAPITFPTLPANSWVEVTGICAPEPTTASFMDITRDIPGDPPNGVVKRSSAVAGFHLLLRSPQDIRVLQTPPWWTPARIAIAFGVLALTGAGVVGWNLALRRRVARQTAVIARQIENDRIAEERRRIARDLHDSLEQHLAGIHLLARTAARQAAAGSDQLSRSLQTLSSLAQHSQEEARRSVWDLRTPGQTPWSLNDGLRIVAEEAMQLTDGLKIDIEAEGAAPRLAATTEHHLLRIAQEAVSNAIKHGRAQRIVLRLRTDAEMLVLEIADNGSGFDPAILEQPIPGHFGVHGMRERAGKLGGTLTLESSTGGGATVRLTLPLAASPSHHA